MTNTSGPLEAALQYAAQGWPVFPCRSRNEPGKDRDGQPIIRKPKSPLTQYGFKEATKTKRIIERWWRDNPDAMIGVPTGAKSGFWVLDIDVPGAEHAEDGRPWLAEMISIYGPLPPTRTVRTATGGAHYYWKHVDGVRNKAALAPGVDTRGDGGFVCVPGSVMEDGTFYDWEDPDAPIADAPEWLIEKVLRKKFEISEYAPERQTDEPPTATEIDELLSYIHPDIGYSDWVAVLMAVHAVLGNDGLAIADAWSARGKKYKRGEVARKWRRFDPGGGVGLGTLCELARQGGADLGEIARRHHAQDDSWITPEGAAKLASGLLKKKDKPPAAPPPGAPEPDAPKPEPPKRAVTAHEFIIRDPSLIPRREFLFGQHYVRKYLTATFGAGGGGKSANAVTEALAIATGRPLMGGGLNPRARVWYVNCEDPDVEIERRFAGAIKHYRIDAGSGRYDLHPGYLYADSGRTQEFVVMKEDGRRTLVCVPVVDAIIAEIKEKQIDVMIVDPFVSTHEVEENDNNKIQRVASQWVHIAEQTNCSIELIHHVTKGNLEITADSGRGAGALKDKCRSVRTINPMSETDADNAGVARDDRFGYFRLDFGKANLTKRSGRSDWRRFESVRLGNGRGNVGRLSSDEIGVVVPWEWPTTEKIIEDGFTPEQLELIRIKIANEDCKYDQRGSPWAGEVIAYALELDMAGEAWKKKAKGLLDALIKQGELEIETDKDPVSRKVKKYVRAAESQATEN